MVTKATTCIENFSIDGQIGAAEVKDSISAGVDIVKNHFDTIIWFKLNNKFLKLQMTFTFHVSIFGVKIHQLIIILM